MRLRSTSREHWPVRQYASHCVYRAAKAVPCGIWHPSVMQFYSGPLIHFLSGVDTSHAGGDRSRANEAHAPCVDGNEFALHPVQAAMSAATLDEFFPGRITLCLGVGTPGDLKSIGIEAEKPLRIMREGLELARALLSGETVRVNGEFFCVQGRRLATGARPVPLVLAASGPRMLELAGAATDGVLLSAGTSIEFVKRSLELVHHAAKGRPVRSHGLVYAAVDEDETLAHDRLRRILAIVLRGSHHAPNLEQGGSSLDQSALNEAVMAEDWSRAEALCCTDSSRAKSTPRIDPTARKAFSRRLPIKIYQR